jgi:hypothetical protein
MKGDVVYVVRKLFKSELVGMPTATRGIIIQQLTDGVFTYRHFGVDVGDGTVIHFSGFKPSTARIVHTSIDEFLDSGKLYKDLSVETDSNYKKFTRDEIIRRAKSYIGNDYGGYDLVNNNCEHFAKWCALDKNTSNQVFFKNDDRDIVEKAIDRAFDPILKMAEKIDNFFGW